MIRSEINFHRILLQQEESTTYLRGADDVHSKQQCVQRTHSDFKEKLSESMIKKYNDYKCLAPFRRRQCHCCCYPAYQSCWLIIPLRWHQFYGLWNASQCFHNAIQLGHSIHHWAGESLLIGWRADCHSPAEEGHGFWRSGPFRQRWKKWGAVRVRRAEGHKETHNYTPLCTSQAQYRRLHTLCSAVTAELSEIEAGSVYGFIDFTIPNK